MGNTTIETTRSVRKAAGLTQRELAWLLGVSLRTIERSDREPIDAPGVPWTLVAIAAAMRDGQGPLDIRAELDGGDIHGAWLSILARVSAQGAHWEKRAEKALARWVPGLKRDGRPN